MMLAGRLLIAAAAVAGAAAAYWALTPRRTQAARGRLSDDRDPHDVDAASEDSFPASDPPSFTSTTGETKTSAG